MGKKRSKKTAKKTQAVTPPELLHIIPCDAATRDPASGKCSLFGLFDNLKCERLPAPISPFAVFIKLKGGSGMHTLSFDFLDPDGKSVPGKRPVVEAQLDPSGVVEIIVHVTSVELTKSGVHKMLVRSGRRRIGKPREVEVMVEKRK